MIEYFVGIDNSLSGAIAIVRLDGSPVAHMAMPQRSKDTVDSDAVLKFMELHGAFEHNCMVALERPHNFSLGSNATRIMWYCFGKLEAMLECSGYHLFTPLSSAWQSVMLGVFPKGKSKEYAEKAILSIYEKPFARTKKEAGGINDAYLIAEWLRISQK